MSGWKWTITNDHGDVHVTIRGPMTPAEARDLAATMLRHARLADCYRTAARQLIEQAPTTERSRS